MKPSNVYWSDEQWAAIYLRGSNILVSAGAGSGKTAVLSERVLQNILSGISISNMVILTFTNASSLEMKERIRKCLIKNRDKVDPLEIKRLEGAMIETFDAFSLSLVKKYYYLLGCQKDIEIGDSVILNVSKRKIMDEVMDANFDHPLMKNLLDFYTIKNADDLKRMLLTISDKCSILPSYQDFVKNYINHFDVEEINKHIEEYHQLVFPRIKALKNEVEKLVEHFSMSNASEHVSLIASLIRPLLYAETYQEVLGTLHFQLPNLPSKLGLSEEEKEQLNKEKKEIKALLNEITEITSNPDSILFDSIFETKELSCFLFELINQFQERYQKYKLEHNLYEFMDISLLAIRLFKDNPEIKKNFQENIKEILVDEYQDTSDIQEELISLIGNKNIYMVGDIKQSIYRFRNANPDIFKEKFDTYFPYAKGIDLGNKEGIRIDLMKNFRSREEVLSDINLIFERLMTAEIGGASYNEGHRLSFGNLSYQSSLKEDYHMEIMTYDSQEKRSYVEACLIGRDILSKKGKYWLFDKSTKTPYLARFKDFTILTLTKSNYEVYQSVFLSMGIPLLTHKEDAFFFSDEIYVISSILRILYSWKDKEYYALNYKAAMASLLRSFLVMGKDDDINLALNDHKEEEFFKEVMEKLKLLLKVSNEEGITLLLENLYSVFELYTKSLTIGNVKAIESKLQFLLKKVISFEQNGFGLKELVEYFDMMNDNEIDMEFQQERNEKDCVAIMTIHKSKGLEFPICYFSDLKTRFNKKEYKDMFLFDSDMGIILPYFKNHLCKTFYHTLYQKNHDKMDISEKIRLFYVALTRAKEKMIFVLPVFEGQDNPIPEEFDKLKMDSFMDMLCSIVDKKGQIGGMQFVKEVDCSFVSDMISNKKKDKEEMVPVIPGEFKTYQNQVEKSVHNTHQASIISGLISNKELKDKMKFGTHVHLVLETLDFNHPNFCDIEPSLIPHINELLKFIETMKPIAFFKEQEFEFQDHHGIIDLVIESDNEYLVLDYKLKDITKPDYQKQVQIYMDYIRKNGHKKVRGILYSLFDDTYEVLECE